MGEIAVAAAEADVLALTETWLKDYDHIPDVISNLFDTYRIDKTGEGPGGGVAIFVRRGLDVHECNISLSLRNIQLTGCVICSRHTTLTVICAYRSPNSSADDDERLLQTLSTVTSNGCRLVIVGDFNFPDVDWRTQDAPPGSSAEAFLGWLQEKSLFQHVYESTRYRHGQQSSVLDLIITTQEEDVSNVEVLPPFGKSDHVLLSCTLILSHRKQTTNWKRNFGRVNQPSLERKAKSLV